MDSLETGIFCVCMAAMGLRLAEGLLPMPRFSKQLRTLFLTMILLSLLRPLVGMSVSSMLPRWNAETYGSELEAMGEAARCEALGGSIRKSLQAELDAHRVECEILLVDVHIEENGGIVIDEVWITGSVLTGTVYLREWLGEGVNITPQKEALP